MSGYIKKLLMIALFIAFTYGFTVAAVSADDTNSEVFTLEKSVKEAIDKNWGVKIKEQAIEEAQYGKKKARADLLPRFSTTYSYRREGG
jgi:outer membrane protein TolC